MNSKAARPWLRAVSDRSGAPQPTDQEIIRAVVSGDHRVAAELYSRLASVVDRTLLRIFGRREADHDDLMQTAFEQIVLTLARQSYAGNCSLKTWAARVTSNVGLNALRARRRERNVLDRHTELPPEGVPMEGGRGDLERSTHARTQLKKVMLELATMNPRRAQAVFLHDLEGYALQEIADITGVTVAAAQSRLVRGRKELLKRLDRKSRGVFRAGEKVAGDQEDAPESRTLVSNSAAGSSAASNSAAGSLAVSDSGEHSLGVGSASLQGSGIESPAGNTPVDIPTSGAPSLPWGRKL